MQRDLWQLPNQVSTHSRLKAAGLQLLVVLCVLCFNTQPPEGGWLDLGIPMPTFRVSTHSRLKAAEPT